MREPAYCTRESVMAAPDIRASAYAAEQIDDAILTGARAVEKLLHRTFYPLTATKVFDWPNAQSAGSYRLWLDQHDLISATNVTSGGVDITASVMLEPAASGPPYTRIDIDRSSSAVLNYASGTGQRSLSITGLWCYSNDELTAGTLSAGAVTADGTLSYTPAARPAGVGSTLRIGTERVLVSEKRWTDSGQTASLAADARATSVAVSSGSAFVPGEEIMIDSERLLVTAIAGNSLIVRRAWAGTVLAAHTTAAVYWPRSLVVERGALGTSAGNHSNGATLYVHQPPSMVSALNRAYALDTFFQEGSGYARTIGSGDAERSASGQGVRALEERTYGAYGRRVRMRAV